MTETRKRDRPKKVRPAKIEPEAVKRMIKPDPIEEIAPQAKELLDRILELRSLAPVLAEAADVVKKTESRIRVVRQELTDLMAGLLPGLPAEEPDLPERAPRAMPMATNVPVDDPDPRGFEPPGDPMSDWKPTGVPTAEDFNRRLCDCELGPRTIASCNTAGMMTIGKVVEWLASGKPFASIQGIGPSEDKELRDLCRPFGPMLPKIRANLGMA